MNIVAIMALVVAGFTVGSLETGPSPSQINAGPCDPAVSRCL